ncbi:MAG TPA: hypothetical protein VHF01_09410 [Candidatus Acidoferrum sp.]|nr:hypothetical protein [Candidatus Acidoferrum sp.]
MSFLFSFYVILVVLLLLLLGWALRTPRKRGGISVGPATLEETGQPHVTYLPQIRQALAPADLEFLASRASAKLTRGVRKERRRIALIYLSAVQEDFQRLLRLARVIAVLSPEVCTAQEFERLRLGVQFTLRSQMIRMRLLCGIGTLPQLSGLSQMVSAFAVRMETAITELGERAALATELASSLERRGVGLS